ncbi:MAG: hypothetical protein HN909_04145 [Phycisphaerales bacterium]|jgi:hypothetical protein|nr:hypothetical protein [Phycisphaerales bacterium]MBT7170943.1 hypothetical protein [Phycisphaerales bacterium]
MKRFAMLMLVAMFLVAGCGKKAEAPAAKTDCEACGVGNACKCPAPK